jgi:CheY-like chemotaxis protein
MSERRLIMVVDDDADIRETVADVLQDEGYAVELAANGREVLEHLHASTRLPDLILLDLMMPELDGWGVLAELEKVPRLASIPVVVFSAYASDDTSVAALKVRGFVRKPLRLEDLLDVIARSSS